MSNVVCGVCVQCETYLRPKTNEVQVLEVMGNGEPYRLWNADLMECPKCKRETIGGFARRHFAEHYENGFAELLKEPYYKVGPLSE